MDYDSIEWKEGVRRLEEAQTEIAKLHGALAECRDAAGHGAEGLDPFNAHGYGALACPEEVPGFVADQFQRLRAENAQLKHRLARHDLQAIRWHPAPCAGSCEANAYKIEIRRLNSSLAASQAREAKLLEVLQRLQSHHYNPFEPENQSATYQLIFDATIEPADAAALRERLAQERERIAEYVDRNLMTCREYADAIRAMGDER